jgi:membrane peptidoglycan carboxypeptidase
LSRVLLLAVIAVLTGGLVAALALPIVGGAGLETKDLIGQIAFTDLPASLQSPPLAQRSVILASDGSQLATFYYENRQSVPLDNIAPAMRSSIVAIEDSRFYEHHGVDPKGILRALAKDSSSGSALQGASTITQQYVRQTLVETDAAANNAAGADAARAKNLARKVQEARYALALEQKLSKDQILDDYLNTVYFGNGAYGIEAASQHYFREDADQLTLPQAALLSGIINNPSIYDPILNPKNALGRRNTVLQRMADLKYIPQSTANQAIATPLDLKVTQIPNGCATSVEPFFCQYVVDEILNNSAYGTTEAARTQLLLTGGLTIYTTLDPTSQAAAQKAVDAVVPPDPAANSGLAAAIDMLDPQTGAIKAMAVDRTFGTGIGQTEVNYAADQAHGGSLGRDAGSTFKIFVLAVALEQGISTGTTFPTPDTLTVPKGAMTDCNGNPSDQWKLGNAADGEGGAGGLDMINATWKSVNTYFAQLEEKTGLCDPVKLATAMGVKKSTGGALDQFPSFVLGADGVDPLSVAGAFATLANQGTYCAPEAITRVTSTVGGHTTQVLVSKPNCTSVLKPQYADGVTSLLQGVLDQKSGTAYGFSIGRPAAGKTGTDDDYRNAWFSGYTPNLASSVWVGNPDFTTSMKGVTVNGKTYPGGVFGATLPAPIWQQAMEGATANLPVESFAQPPDSVLKGNPIPVPDLVGKTPTQAAAALTALGLKPVIDPTPSVSDEAVGTVASTNPQAGTTVFLGATVTIEISSGLLITPPVFSGSPPVGSPVGSAPAGSLPPSSPTANPPPTPTSTPATVVIGSPPAH